MIHYHGTPITPAEVLEALPGRNFCVSFYEPRDLERCHRVGQSVMLDNGAFTFWRHGVKTDEAWWESYYEWVEPWLDYQTTWAVIPDVIDGDEADNDRLLAQWPFGSRGAPVWHLHESLDRLLRLASNHPRICLGSSGEYADPDSHAWRHRIDEAFNALCGHGPAPVWIHMLRAMEQACAGPWPFASADSTNVAQNHNRKGSPVDERIKRAKEIADRVDGRQAPAVWVPRQQLEMAA